MAKQNINESEKAMIKKRYTVGMIVSGVLLLAGAALTGFSVFGLLASFAVLLGGVGALVAGVSTFIFAHVRKKNRLEVLAQRGNVEERENKQDKVKAAENQKTMTLSKEEEAVRKANMAKEIGPNTFAVRDADSQSIFKDHNGMEMIYNINGRNNADIRRIIPSLTENELKYKTKYIISIYDGNNTKNNFLVSKETFKEDMTIVYANIGTVRKEYRLEQTSAQPKESVEEEKGMEPKESSKEEDEGMELGK